MLRQITFTVPGRPQGKGRPRFTTRGGYPRTYTPDATANYEALIKLCWQEAIRGREQAWSRSGQFLLSVIAHFRVPASWPKQRKRMANQQRIRPTVKCDWDNIGKVICDALNGLAFTDDSKIVCGRVEKYYVRKPDEEERVEVKILNITDPEDVWSVKP